MTGTMTVPPPMPKKPASNPASTPTTAMIKKLATASTFSDNI
jgi:hypothetical protein